MKLKGLLSIFSEILLYSNETFICRQEIHSEKLFADNVLGERYRVEKSGRGYVIIDELGFSYSSVIKLVGRDRYICSKKNGGCRASIFVSGDFIIGRSNEHLPKAHNKK